jgi:hypothetical protein
MEYELFFSEIEKRYLENDFEGVIKVWEAHSDLYELDYALRHDDKILEAIVTSYYELNSFKKCLYYLNKQIKQLTFLQLSREERYKKRRYYFLTKVNIYSILNKRITKYKIAKNYLQLVPADETFEKIVKHTEEYYYKKYITFNKYFGYVFLGLVLLAVFSHLLDFKLNSTLYVVYNIFTIAALIWLSINFYFPSMVKRLYLKGFRALI